MEAITNTLKNIKLEDEQQIKPTPLTVLREIPSAINYQKCMLPLKLLAKIAAVPGDAVMLIYKNTKYILKAYQNFSNSNNIAVYGIVECVEQQRIQNEPYVLEKIESLFKFSSVDIDLVCDSTQISYWLTEKNKLTAVIERRILRNLLFCPNSVVNLDTFSDAITLGLRKVVVINTTSCGIGFINSRTKINIRHIITEAQYYSNKSSQTHFFGAERIVNELNEMFDLNTKYKKMENKLLAPIKQVLLAGPSGCGKSSLVHQLSHKKRLPLVRIIGHNIHSKDPGQSEKILRNMVKESFLYAKSEGICILLLEDIDVICPRGRNVAPHTARLSAQLLHLLDECQDTDGVIVIATTNKPASIHGALRRHGRLAKEIILGKPSESERAEIISGYLDIFCCFSTDQVAQISKTIAKITPGYLGADLKLLCQTACSKMFNVEEEPSKMTIISVMKDVLLQMKPASLRNEVEVVSSGAPIQLGGLKTVRRQLELSVYCSLLQPHVYTRMGIQKPRGILLYGPPGCAKTSLAKSLASAGNITVLFATNASIYSPYVGDAEKAIVNLFHNARQNAPAVIFIDEIDSLVGSRSEGSGSNDVQERVLAALLTQMDGIGITKQVADDKEEWADGDGVMVIAATNRPNEIDPALLRPGRFDRHIYVPPPDKESRLDILKLVSKNTPLDINVRLDVIAEKTQFYSGADLKNLHKEAVLHAMQTEGVNVSNIRQSHYEDVLKVVKASLNEHVVNQFVNIF